MEIRFINSLLLEIGNSKQVKMTEQIHLIVIKFNKPNSN